MAIVHMDKRVSKFREQLAIHSESLKPEIMFFDYDGDKEISKYEAEETINLFDFAIIFNLLIVQTGVFTEGNLCQPSEYDPETTEITIEDLIVHDDEKGEYLRFNREEFSEIIQEVKNLIMI